MRWAGRGDPTLNVWPRIVRGRHLRAFASGFLGRGPAREAPTPQKPQKVAQQHEAQEHAVGGRRRRNGKHRVPVLRKCGRPNSMPVGRLGIDAEGPEPCSHTKVQRGAANFAGDSGTEGSTRRGTRRRSLTSARHLHRLQLATPTEFANTKTHRGAF